MYIDWNIVPPEWVHGPEYLQLLLIVTDLILTTCAHGGDSHNQSKFCITI